MHLEEAKAKAYHFKVQKPNWNMKGPLESEIKGMECIQYIESSSLKIIKMEMGNELCYVNSMCKEFFLID